ncbi:protein translocase subunit SecF [Alkalicoccobacillus murimartini]|uniref:Protein-export membrane protein SecF n=1 Tax=Alkalicoccobacillus murimartini TaxID=171685 RepID=A0ABT9YCQ5_9BACI|nr:protein translocase subunit SecF [Alkalicoccobacillus murimartini]MDQ0205408.1 preprotein translocase SecF subunit [Alkalicoccobacillus murimartini]
MSFNDRKWKLDFITHRNKFFAASLVFVIAGIISLFTLGLNLGVDFESGSNITIETNETLTNEQIQEDFAEINSEYTPTITLAGENNEIATVRFIDVLNNDEVADVRSFFLENYDAEPTVSTVSPQVGKELAQNAIYAVLIASLGIVIYLAFRYEFLYGAAAIVALLYDAFFIIALFSFLQVEVNVPFIAAVLTIVGYSINDTIVTFDRIRENVKKAKVIEGFDDLAEIVNTSLIQTISRSINTVLTVVFAALSLLLFGGDAIFSFSLALVIGLVAGTYSSMFIAAQLWLVWKARYIKKQRLKPVDPSDEEPTV